MKTKAASLSLLFVMSCGLAADPPNWTPFRANAEVKGTIAVPPEFRHATGLSLPEVFSFDLKVDSHAERIAETDRSQASISYIIVVHGNPSNQFYLNLTNTVETEVTGDPQEAVIQTLAIIRNIAKTTLKEMIATNAAAVHSTNAAPAPTSQAIIKRSEVKPTGSASTNNLQRLPPP